MAALDENVRDSDECSLNLSYESSSFDESDEGTSSLGIKPYMFEPYECGSSGDEAESPLEGYEEPDSPEEEPDRLLDATNWCLCSHCSPMETTRECRCCVEIPQIKALMDNIDQCTCITEHQGFEPSCLNRYTLDIAYSWYRQQYHEALDQNEKYRYTAYRQIVRWAWNFLGKKIRVILPACVVRKIRERYPSESYTGFRDAI